MQSTSQTPAFITPAALPGTLTRRKTSQLSCSPRLALAKPPSTETDAIPYISEQRTTPVRFATSTDTAPYVGTPPPTTRGRLRFAPGTRFRPPAPAPPVETYANTAWQRGTLVSRSLAIWSFIGGLLAANWRDEQSWTYFPGGRTPERLAARRRRLASYARERILELGPTMIKVGQLASTRADLLPPEVVDELRLLQDRVPAFDWPTARDTLEREYGRPVEEVFAYFEKTPIAAASLGQVHRAVLPSGDHVVVKIQRPKLKELFDLDLNALRMVAQYLDRSKRYGGNGRDWVGIYEECSRVLYEEIDYEREGRSCERFGDNFRNAGIDWVKVPQVYFSYTTRRVLCLQYLPGIKISDVDTLRKAGLDTKLIANRAASAFIREIVDWGYFSADPHPGNLAVGANESIIFYDFGMMGELNPRVKERLIDILSGVLERDAALVMDALVDLGALVLPADPTPVRRAIQFFLDSIGNRPSREQTVAAIGDDLYATAYDKPFRLPAASIFLLRAFSTLEGLAKGLDPDFKFADVALPYADGLLKDRTGFVNTPRAIVRSFASSVLTGRSNDVTRDFSRRVVNAGSSAVRAVSRIEKIEKTLSQLENGDIKIRSRSTETEKLLRKQYSLTQSSNLLLSTSATALAASQLYIAGQTNPAIALASFSAVLGLMFLRSQAKLNKKDRYSNSD